MLDERAITNGDLDAFIEGYYGLRNRPESLREAMISKDPRDMPSDAPLVSFQGRDPGPPAKYLIWISTAPRATADPRYGDADFAAQALIVMDTGHAGRTLQALYARTPPDRASRQRLSDSFVRAFNAASDRRARSAAGQAAWIKEHVAPGITRAAAYRLLKSKGLTAYNEAFIKGKALPGNWCVTRDRSSGAWPYMNEPRPKQPAGCAVLNGYKRVQNPDAEVDLAGAFNIACGWSTRVVIAFNRGDRVAAVKVGDPVGGCL